MPTPSIQRRWKNLPGEPVGDAGDPYTGYDRFGRTEQMQWWTTGGSPASLVNVQWGYNRASQKTWRKDLLAPASTGQDQHFGYDGLYQVTERQRGLLNVNTTAVGGIPAQQENFSYDETGNWITYKQSNEGALDIDETRVNNRSNQMTQVDGSSAGISYDANGNMLTVPTGEGLTGPSRKLVWDAWSRLRKVSDADDNVIAQYQYDGKTRRTKVESGGITKHCYYDDQWRTVEEQLDASTTPVTQHVWHPANRWELLFRDRSTANNGTLDERLYSLKDQLDPVAVCDTSGSVVERYEYTAFGMPTFLDSSFIPQTSSLVDWSFLFHAEFADIETGWFNYGYRYYPLEIGSWANRDPIGESGGVHLYSFCGSDPIQKHDNFGLYIDAYTEDVNALPLNVGPVRAGSAAETFADWVVTPLIKNAWFGDRATLELSGSLTITINRLITRDPNHVRSILAPFADVMPNENTTQTTAEHEHYHALIIQRHWNNMRFAANKYEGSYCPAKCATLAQNVVYALKGWYEAQARYDNERYDMAVYGGHLWASRSFDKTLEIRVAHAKTILDKEISAFAFAKCLKP